MPDFIDVTDKLRARLEACLETLDGLVASGERFRQTDMEAVRAVCDPTLQECYAALALGERQRNGSHNSLRINGYLATGELTADPPPATFNELYEAAGNLLDRVESHDILGNIVFLAEDGKWYQLSTEAVVMELSDEDVEALRNETEAALSG
jgi:hypothetical protein